MKNVTFVVIIVVVSQPINNRIQNEILRKLFYHSLVA